MDILVFSWCGQGSGVAKAFGLIKAVLNIVRFIVPIALIVMTTLDVIKKVINPDDKEGQKKIMYRAIGALVVFFTPTIISFLFRVIDIGRGKSGTYDTANASLSACWRNS